mgnify:CR=1 FL=1
MTVIYVDTLFLLNTMVDYLLLLASARLAGEPSSWNLPSRVYSVPGPSRTRSRVLRATNSVISVPHISRFKKDMRT